jgi:hypothetical protein
MARAVLFALGVVALLGPATRAAEDDLVKAKLDKAKAVYDAQLDKLCGNLVKSLQDKEEAARKAGNKKLVDQVKTEREAFETRGDLPKSISTANFTRDCKQARATLELAYTTAIKEYTKAKMDDEAAVVEKDLEAFRQDTGQAGATLAQLLAQDSAWSGMRRIANDKGKLNQNPFKLKISARDGKTFKGQVEFLSRKYDVEGVVEGDRIAFATEKKGNLKHNYEGRLRGRTLELAFSGTGMSNEQVKGLVVLTRDKGK